MMGWGKIMVFIFRYSKQPSMFIVILNDIYYIVKDIN